MQRKNTNIIDNNMEYEFLFVTRIIRWRNFNWEIFLLEFFVFKIFFWSSHNTFCTRSPTTKVILNIVQSNKFLQSFFKWIDTKNRNFLLKFDYWKNLNVCRLPHKNVFLNWKKMAILLKRTKYVQLNDRINAINRHHVSMDLFLLLRNISVVYFLS